MSARCPLRFGNYFGSSKGSLIKPLRGWLIPASRTESEHVYHVGTRALNLLIISFKSIKLLTEYVYSHCSFSMGIKANWQFFDFILYLSVKFIQITRITLNLFSNIGYLKGKGQIFCQLFSCLKGKSKFLTIFSRLFQLRYFCMINL